MMDLLSIQWDNMKMCV